MFGPSGSSCGSERSMSNSMDGRRMACFVTEYHIASAIVVSMNQMSRHICEVQEGRHIACRVFAACGQFIHFPVYAHCSPPTALLEWLLGETACDAQSAARFKASCANHDQEMLRCIAQHGRYLSPLHPAIRYLPLYLSYL